MKLKKIGEVCDNDKECINNRCISNKCTRKVRIKKNKPNISLKETSIQPIKKRISKTRRRLIIEDDTESSLPIKKKKRSKTKRKLIIEDDTESDLDIYAPIVIEKPDVQSIYLPIPNNTEINKRIDETNIKIKEANNNMDQIGKRMNEAYINLMEELYDLMMKKGEPFRARAYKKAEETILLYEGSISNPDQLKGYPNIGPTILEKLKEFTNTGKVMALEKYKNSPEVKLTEIHGIGPKKAKELVEKGITTIDDLKTNVNTLNDVQKKGLKYYDDIKERIPREEIDEFRSYFEKVFKKVAPQDGKMEIVGSYRRGLNNSGDIDLIMTSSDKGIFNLFINELLKENIIKEVLSKGPTKSLVIAQLPGKKARRVDFLYATPQEYPFAILYFTGSKTFNTVMRGIALKQGYTMNEHGLYDYKNKKKGEKVNHIFDKEEDIFTFLQLSYVNPTNRIDGRQLKPISKPPSVHSEPLTQEVLQIQEKIEKETIKKPANKTRKVPQKKKTINHNIEKFKNNGITVLESLNELELNEIIIMANDQYYNENPILDDNQYDIIKEYIEEKYPQNNVIKNIGAPVKKQKVALPFEMWSMDKIKPNTNALANWQAKFSGPYLLSCKLDGVSGLYTTHNQARKLYTRGNGKIGQDISHLIPYLKLPDIPDIAVRGEFIISKNVFTQKYSDKFANPRNMVSGIINQKNITNIIHDVDFVAYEIIQPSLLPIDQVKTLQKYNFVTVKYTVESKIDNILLSNLLVDWRNNYQYEIDGIIVTNNAIYPRLSKNPEHAFAFKMVLTEQIAEAKVLDVIWTPSKDGYLKPRIRIEPIQLGGVKIEYATGFNAAFIVQNKIGIGATIQIIRSGDVIPYVQKVIQPASQPKMPDVPYIWNQSHIDILIENIQLDVTVQEKNITGFFKGIGVDGLSTGNIKKMILAGFDTVPKIIQMTPEDFLSVDGFKEKTAQKLYQGIRNKLSEAKLPTIMAASNRFGRGFSDKKIELIMNHYPDILTSTDENSTKLQKLLTIKGMSTKTAQAFLSHIPEFLQFIQDIGYQNKLDFNPIQKTFDETHPLFEKSIVMTGFRDNNLANQIENVGGKISNSVSKNTFALLVKNNDDIEEGSGKISEAKKFQIPIMTLELFKQKYHFN